MYHDASEVITGDMPTPIKYHNPQIAHEYKKNRKICPAKLIEMLPKNYDDFRPFIDEQLHSEEEAFIVKTSR